MNICTESLKDYITILCEIIYIILLFEIKLFSDWLRIVFTAVLSALFIRNITPIKGNTMRYILALASSYSLIRL